MIENKNNDIFPVAIRSSVGKSPATTNQADLSPTLKIEGSNLLRTSQLSPLVFDTDVPAGWLGGFSGYSGLLSPSLKRSEWSDLLDFKSKSAVSLVCSVQFKMVCMRSEKPVCASSFDSSLLQAIDGVMSLALCPQVMSQASQHFRSSEKLSMLT